MKNFQSSENPWFISFTIAFKHRFAHVWDFVGLIRCTWRSSWLIVVARVPQFPYYINVQLQRNIYQMSIRVCPNVAKACKTKDIDSQCTMSLVYNVLIKLLFIAGVCKHGKSDGWLNNSWSFWICNDERNNILGVPISNVVFWYWHKILFYFNL